MTRFLKTHGTTFTIVLFTVSAVSGLFLFFHFGSAYFHSMHEWLSLVLILPVGVHLWRNWNGFSTYLKQGRLTIPLVIGLVGSLAFALPAMTSTSSGGNPVRAALSAIEQGTVAEVAPLFDLSAAELTARLEAKGYRLGAGGQSLADIANASGKQTGPALISDIAFAGD
ncbi:hypothetical protein [Stappia sp. ES.058]|uniref:hypothetical protein n=1 Tax=Stappia sp. ES.058 TaxID=1881061 RepID=UPI00087D764E|nr:hypothetical protein [Stappia sp. ES.058]SDU17353.1 hypothetical protein SAMN05428979_2078 [Stappia sp. ES.058]